MAIEQIEVRAHYDLVERLLPKFCDNGRGRIDGYGIVKFP